MSDRAIPVGVGVEIVRAWLERHFPDRPPLYLPREKNRPHLWRILPGREGPGFRLGVWEDLLTLEGMLRDRLKTVERVAASIEPGTWIVIGARGLEPAQPPKDRGPGEPEPQ